MELYWNENHTKYAILVSCGFGAGWSTWEGKELAYDKRIIEFWLAHKNDEEWMETVEQFSSGYKEESASHKEAREFFKSIGYNKCPYMGGFENIQLAWIPAGVPWRIKEYDGAETIVFQEDENWNCFN